MSQNCLLIIWVNMKRVSYKETIRNKCHQVIVTVGDGVLDLEIKHAIDFHVHSGQMKSVVRIWENLTCKENRLHYNKKSQSTFFGQNNGKVVEKEEQRETKI